MRCFRYYSNAYSNSGYYSSQARMLHEVAGVAGDWDLVGLVTKALKVYKQLNEEED